MWRFTGCPGCHERGAAVNLTVTLDLTPLEGMTLEQIRAARPSKEFDSRFATEICCSPNNVQNSTVWYQQMYNEAKTHLPAPPR